ncbi:MAG: DNA-processing protein DprA [Candidatus Paceibacterota bacterium]|jgi:DNA processing protein
MIQIRKLSPSSFPSALREIADPPKELWLRGELPDETENVFLTVVGSRKYSRYGKEACEKLITGLRGYPIVIVSGLALGMDGIAHRAALDTGLKTVAVPGSGIHPDVIHPRTNFQLAEEIIKTGGAILSEYEPEFRATIWSFPRRNRIMVGLSKAVLVIEAEEKSGTLITARLALDYNRDVLTVPGEIFSPNASGTNRLIRQGATPVTSSEELLRELGFEPNNGMGPDYNVLTDATPDEQKLWGILSEPFERNELLTASGLSIQDFNTALTLLEIKSLITEELGEIRRNG